MGFDDRRYFGGNFDGKTVLEKQEQELAKNLGSGLVVQQYADHDSDILPEDLSAFNILPSDEIGDREFIGDMQKVKLTTPEQFMLLINKHFANFIKNTYFEHGKFDGFEPFSKLAKESELHDFTSRFPQVTKHIRKWQNEGFHIFKSLGSIFKKKIRDNVDDIALSDKKMRDLCRNTLIIDSDKLGSYTPQKLADFIYKKFHLNNAVPENLAELATYSVSEIKMKERANGYQDLTLYLKPSKETQEKLKTFIGSNRACYREIFKNLTLLYGVTDNKKILDNIYESLTIELQITTTEFFMAKIEETKIYDEQKKISSFLNTIAKVHVQGSFEEEANMAFSGKDDISRVDLDGLFEKSKIKSNDGEKQIKSFLVGIQGTKLHEKYEAKYKKLADINKDNAVNKKDSIIQLDAILDVYKDNFIFTRNNIYSHAKGIFSNFDTPKMQDFIRMLKDKDHFGDDIKISHNVPGLVED